jgi:hypothetical protein
MNTNDTRFDRLVDDELNEEERRELLGRLDDESDGWRRCALAFLEAQCWKKVLGQIPNEPKEKEIDKPTTKNPRRSPWTERLTVLSAMAASFLVALLLGTLTHHVWVGLPNGPDASNAIAKKSNDLQPVPQPNRPETELARATPKTSAASDPWHTVTVSTQSDGKPRPLMNVPAVERDNVDEQWLRSMPSAVPDNVVQALNRTGHQIETRREMVPVPLKDGRRLVVPVDQVDVHYVGNQTY